MDKNIGYNLKSGGKNSYLSEYVKEKIGNSQKGEKNHMYGKRGKDNPTSKRVKNITTGVTYDSATICAEAENAIISHICSVCRGERGSHKGNVYRYIDDMDNIILPPKETLIKQKRVRNIELDMIFESISEASIYFTGKTSSKANILKVCNKERKTALNYHWEFA